MVSILLKIVIWAVADSDKYQNRSAHEFKPQGHVPTFSK